MEISRREWICMDLVAGNMIKYVWCCHIIKYFKIKCCCGHLSKGMLIKWILSRPT